MRKILGLSSCLALLAFAPSAWAQFGNEWLEFMPSNRIKNPDGTIATQIVNDTQEKDYAWGDLDQDGWTDLVVVRKKPVSFPGKFPNFLMMNEQGTLVDRTAQYASASNYAGDQGFLTPTDDRDVEIVDVNGDTWLDVVTAATDLTFSGEGTANKYLTHPRVYVNLGNDGGGNWLGLRHEENRIPLLFASPGNPGVVRFCDMHFGDVTGDGAPDLYFVDYDGTETGFGESGALDLNDRLLINDGNGFFTDETSLRMTSAMSQSAFGTAGEIQDMNGDGRNDVLKCTTLTGSLAITVAYNDATTALPDGEGYFDLFQNNAFTGSPYHLATGDLNNDGRLDLVKADDGSDGYRFNVSTGPLGSVNWSSSLTFSFLSGSGDDGFGGSVHVADFDNDGWNDVLINDVDVDLSGCSRRTKIYHNLGGTPGATNVVLKEEKQQSGSGGWFGAKGLLASDMTGGFDSAIFDVDNDGDQDLVMGRCSGTTLWTNTLDPIVCQTDLGLGGPGTATLTMCGSGLASGQSSLLSLQGAPASATAVLFASLTQGNHPFNGGTIVPGAPWLVTIFLTTTPAGTLDLSVNGGGGPIVVYAQYLYADTSILPFGIGFTNGILANFQP